jgi:hypothetical protein
MATETPHIEQDRPKIGQEPLSVAKCSLSLPNLTNWKDVKTPNWVPFLEDQNVAPKLSFREPGKAESVLFSIIIHMRLVVGF